MKQLKMLAPKILILVLLTSWSSLPTFASNQDRNINNSPTLNISLIISDPETGETWEWEVPAPNYISTDLTNSSLYTSSDSEPLYNTKAEIDLGEYLAETFANPEISSTLTDDITITTGLTYSVMGQGVSIKSVFGSTTPKGLYYATDRVVYWRNPGAVVGGVLYPTSNSWSYSTNPEYGTWSSFYPPYSLLDCRVRVSGMSAYRDISVMCKLFL